MEQWLTRRGDLALRLLGLVLLMVAGAALHWLCSLHVPPQLVGRPRPQNALSQLVQVLVMSNEFQFID